jgi:hypothetical protein
MQEILVIFSALTKIYLLLLNKDNFHIFLYFSIKLSIIISKVIFIFIFQIKIYILQ